jgi:hypothetical protein
VGVERGPLSLVSTTEELLERKSSGSRLETENMAVGICHAETQNALIGDMTRATKLGPEHGS